MFKISEFAQIARVTARQLRHYESLDLLRPSHADPATGYRYYDAGQLPRLNRILALKELGFSLEEVARLLDDDISPDALRGMLAIRKSQIEHALDSEQFRLRQIESRIAQIEEQGALRDYDVKIKVANETPFLALRGTFARFPAAVDMLQQVVAAATRKVRQKARGSFAVIAHSDFEDENLDLEMGLMLTERINAPVALSNGLNLTLRDLESVAEMACVVRAGPVEQSHRAYGALGVWMEANDFEISGPCREVFLETPFSRPAPGEAVMEIQFPVRKRAPG